MGKRAGRLTEGEQKVHFAIWCLASAPLMLGNDPRYMSDFEKDILMNPRCIAINQDPTEQGKKVAQKEDKEVWAKKLNDGSWALLLLNRNKTENQKVVFDLATLGIKGNVRVTEVFSDSDMGFLCITDALDLSMSSELNIHR